MKDGMKHKKGPKKVNKIGRNGRTAKHRAGTACGHRHCGRLAESRVYSSELSAYIPRGVVLPKAIVITRAA